MAQYSIFWENKRISKKISFGDLAKALNVSATTVRNYFTGKTSPTPEMTQKLCDILNADYTEGHNEFIQIYYQSRATRLHHASTPQLILPDKYKARPKPPPNITPRTYKDTFWNRLRIARNLRITDIRLQVFPGFKPSYNISLYNWFNGRNIPSEANAKKLCDFFGVDLTKGIAEFKQSHTEWVSAKNHRTFKYSAKEDIQHKTWILDSEESVLSVIYSHVPYEDYKEFENKLQQRLYKEAFQILYGKLDFDTYYQIQVSVDALSKA